jgi:uncharacterized protein YfaS (alpha-2-macroglobulin family)
MVTSNLLIDLLSTLEQRYKAEWPKDVLGAYVAASYALMQQDKQARQFILDYDLSESSQLIDQAFAGLAPRLSLDAQYLYLLAKHFPELLGDVSDKAVLNITQAIYKGQYNTVSAAYSMLALGAYHAALGNENIETIDQKIGFSAASLQQEIELTPLYAPFATAVYPIGTERIKAQIAKSDLPKAGSLYYVNMQAGYRSELPKEALDKHIMIQRAFINESGELASNIKQGDELTIRLRIRAVNLKFIDNIAIVDLLPGGFEVIRKSVARNIGRWQSDYIDIREDRIIFYGNITNRVTEISYKVKVTAAGTFVVPPSFAESMYDRGLRGSSAASSIQIMPFAQN